MTATAADLLDAVLRRDEKTVAAMLRENPALAASRDDNGISALLWACYSKQPAMAALLAAALPALDLFEALAMADDARALALLGADPGAAGAWSRDGFTPLHFAGFFSRPAVAAKLLAMGADVAAEARNPMRVTPLHSAVSARSHEVCRLLLEAGAPPDVGQQHGWTALMSAAMHGDEALVELLLSHGASRAPKDDKGRTAADMAAEKGFPSLAAQLRPMPEA